MHMKIDLIRRVHIQSTYLSNPISAKIEGWVRFTVVSCLMCVAHIMWLLRGVLRTAAEQSQRGVYFRRVTSSLERQIRAESTVGASWKVPSDSPPSLYSPPFVRDQLWVLCCEIRFDTIRYDSFLATVATLLYSIDRYTSSRVDLSFSTITIVQEWNHPLLFHSIYFLLGRSRFGSFFLFHLSRTLSLSLS
jgi:hypothetical protein